MNIDKRTIARNTAGGLSAIVLIMLVYVQEHEVRNIHEIVSGIFEHILPVNLTPLIVNALLMGTLLIVWYFLTTVVLMVLNVIFGGRGKN